MAGSLAVSTPADAFACRTAHTYNFPGGPFGTAWINGSLVTSDAGYCYFSGPSYQAGLGIEGAQYLGERSFYCRFDNPNACFV